MTEEEARATYPSSVAASLGVLKKDTRNFGENSHAHP